MKILIFSVAYHPFVGGAEIAVKEITDRISDIEFHMLTVNLDGKQKREEKIGNIYIYRIGSGYFGKLFFPFFGTIKALSLNKKIKFDLIWSIMANYAGFAALFFKYLKPKILFLLTLQEGDPIEYIKRQVWLVYPLFTQIFRKADKMQTISNYLADFGKSMGFEGKIDVIPNGVDVRKFQIADSKSQTDKKLQTETILITTSRLVVKNGIGDVVKSLQYLPQNVKFLVLGVGPLERELKGLAKNLGLESRVNFLGFVDQKDIPKYLQMSDIFIRPSLSEGMGNSFIEAMAGGVPVIATSVGGIPDFLKDKETGLFCEVKNPKSIAEKVELLMNDTQLRNTVVSNAKKLAFERYDWNLIALDMKKKVFLQIAQKGVT